LTALAMSSADASLPHEDLLGHLDRQDINGTVR
jgi:hypothetical protein